MTSPLPLTQFPEERRLASVLFAEVQGFTGLADKLDYETISDLIKSVWLRLDEVIAAHGGYIDKHIGDAVMAVWGAPYAGENDAEHAVAAALALQSSLNEFTGNLSQPQAKEMKIRVGINTGTVLAGYVGLRNEYNVMGDTVNIAAQLEQAAEPGTVLINESTYRLVRGVFRIRRLAPLQLKGKNEPVSAYQVEGVLPQPSSLRYQGIGSLETHMVGREAEMTRLDKLYRQALMADRPTLVIVTGEAGMGKSRLLMEFTSQLEVEEPAFTLLSARALAQASRVPFFLWKSLWHNRFSLGDDDPPEIAREKFLRELQKLWGKQLGPVSVIEAAHLIGNLTGLQWPNSKYLGAYDEDPEGRVKRAFELTRELLCRACEIRPTVLLFDDLQWADSGSLNLLQYLLQPVFPQLPMLILAGARPEFLRQQPRWANVAKVVTLDPLPINASGVATAYPDLRGMQEEVLDELASRADGNPYFLEEMVKSLVKTGMTEAGHSPQEIVEKLRDQPPESLRVMLQARLDALSREARSVALLASVVGRVFWVGAVIAAARAAAGSGTGPLVYMPTTVVERVIQDALRQLVRAELAFPRASSRFSGDQEYIFKHSLLRDVAYTLVPHKNRKQYHLAVAHWLVDRVDPDFKLMAADHYERAGAFFDASHLYENAAQYATSRGATKEAEKLHARAQSLREKIEEV